MPERVDDYAVAALRELHAEVDAEAGKRAARLGDRLQCRRGCHDCCSDDLSVSLVEARCIEVEAGTRLRGESPHAAGGCAFLGADGACRIYRARPYICRTQGLPLRWFDPAEPGVERRDICPLNAPGGPIEEIPDADCWLLGPFEERLDALAAPGERITLRSLFTRISAIRGRGTA